MDGLKCRHVCEIILTRSLTRLLRFAMHCAVDLWLVCATGGPISAFQLNVGFQFRTGAMWTHVLVGRWGTSGTSIVLSYPRIQSSCRLAFSYSTCGWHAHMQGPFVTPLHAACFTMLHRYAVYGMSHR